MKRVNSNLTVVGNLRKKRSENPSKTNVSIFETLDNNIEENPSTNKKKEILMK